MELEICGNSAGQKRANNFGLRLKKRVKVKMYRRTISVRRQNDYKGNSWVRNPWHLLPFLNLFDFFIKNHPLTISK